MIEMSVEKCHQRTHALAKLIKCAREEDQEMISGALDVVERVRARVEDAGGDAREETRGGGATTTTTFDHAAFERRMDARVDRLIGTRRECGAAERDAGERGDDDDDAGRG